MLLDLRSDTEWRAFYDARYESLVDRIVSYLPPDTVVLDVGANVGFYAIPMARRLQGIGGRLAAFEPVAANYDRLLQNIRANGVDDTVDSYRLALGDDNTSLPMLVCDGHGSSTGNALRVPAGNFSDRESRWRRETAQMSRLDDHVDRMDLRGMTCSLIKVDIEGHEPCFLRGASQFIGKHRPLILAEVNPRFLNANGLTPTDYFDVLGPEGYRAFECTGAPWTQRIHPEDFSMDKGFYSVLFAPPGFSSDELGVSGSDPDTTATRGDGGGCRARDQTMRCV